MVIQEMGDGSVLLRLANLYEVKNKIFLKKKKI